MTTEIEFEGTTLVCEPIKYELDENNWFVFENLQPGDIYIGKRNTGWQMSTISKRLWDNTRANGWVYGEDIIYPYNVGECLKVLDIKE